MEDPYDGERVQCPYCKGFLKYAGFDEDDNVHIYDCNKCGAEVDSYELHEYEMKKLGWR